jgi:hypothetical protein
MNGKSTRWWCFLSNRATYLVMPMKKPGTKSTEILAFPRKLVKNLHFEVNYTSL